MYGVSFKGNERWTTRRRPSAWRLTLLRESHLSLLDIATQVGYQSQAAFSKKFKETYGEAPGRLRSSGG
ncbi:helix-turn-helix domain-containing protein [Pseudomonas simiae]|uniref:helix-turn-helix domain-containing protein n=1 Tax=Pseudomonas simiae TaxID=321846 RepID=UPI0039964FF4